MSDISVSLSLARAFETYELGVRDSALGPTDPAHISDEIAYLRRLFLQLKFQYLEQEARDKFISFLLSKDAVNVQQTDLDELIEQNSASQQELKQVESELEASLEACRARTDEVISMSKKWESLKADADSAFAAHEELQKELNELVETPGKEGFAMILELNKMIGSYELAPEEAIRIAQKDLQEDRAKLDDLTLAHDEYAVGVASRDELIAELSAQLSHLKVQLDRPAPAENANDPQQVRAHWLRGLNALLAKLTPRPVEVVHTDGTYTLACGDEKVVFDEELRILHPPDFLQHSVEKTRVNFVNDSQRRLILSSLLEKMVSG